jgi:hypothetical protein
VDKVVRIKLSEPLTTLAGQTFSELTADFSKVRTRDLAAINKVAKRIKGGEGFDLGIGALNKAADPDFRIACTWIACLKGTVGLCLDDLDGLTLSDCLDLADYSVVFLSGTSSQPSDKA